MSRGLGRLQRLLIALLQDGDDNPPTLTVAQLQCGLEPDVDEGSLRRSLKRLVEDGVVAKIGRGGLVDPYYYFINSKTSD